MRADASHILTLSCPDRIGISAAVTGLLAELQANIVDSQQYGDGESGRFFLRIAMVAEGGEAFEAQFRAAFAAVAQRFGMDWQLHATARPLRTVIMVSRFDHCLNDLLYRHRIGALPMDLRAIVSNHRDAYRMAAADDIPFIHIPVTAATKARAEARLLEVLAEEEAELVVLARYMQVLSDDLCRQLAGRCINIHHSFLPSFKGARPYHQAHARGVKLIGATAHYVTADLDEGPIVEQEAVRVDHRASPDDLVATGRDVECRVLARAVRYHLEHRILLNGQRTVVFG